MPSLLVRDCLGKTAKAILWTDEPGSFNLRLDETGQRADRSQADPPSDDAAERQKQRRNRHGRKEPQAVCMARFRVGS